MAREYLRLLQRQYRCARDAGVRGRRLVREVASFWRRAERESFETRKRVEREEIENRRRQIEQAEAERQKKKLEFLLTQTELYSHFIGRKMGIMADEEKKTQAPTSTPGASAAAAATPAVKAEGSNGTTSGVAAPSSSSLPIGSDTASLLAHASLVKNESNISADDAARSYIQAQKAKLAEFDQLESRTTNIANAAAAAAAAGDDTEMTDAAAAAAATGGESKPAAGGVGGSTDDPLDLLNPSTMPEQELFVQAASSFKGTLKSYQLRGLNWLLNLYDQGINGQRGKSRAHTRADKERANAWWHVAQRGVV